MPRPSKSMPSVLLIEDTLSLAKLYLAYLRDEACEVIHAETGVQAEAFIADSVPDVILLDLVLPDMDGLDILRRISENETPTSVIVVTAHGTIKVAVDAMRLGACDFLIKPFSADRLIVTVRNALERQRLASIVETYKNDFDRGTYLGFIGSSLAMQVVYRMIDSAATSKATVFITGESGTGKEICAEAIHARSHRADKPFIAINCGAIPHDLMESEIFGHVKGAFTGAVADRQGAAERAEGGTLFLDEICELELSLQIKLLRFIQLGTYQMVGGSVTKQSDIRFICATNRDPQEEVAAGRFREDLFYRLHVVPIILPPLRDRERDVLEIAGKFLEDFSEEEGKSFRGFSPDTSLVLQEYNWPGNIRQLQNVIRNMVVLYDGETITVDMLPAPLNIKKTGDSGEIVNHTDDGSGARAQKIIPPQSHITEHLTATDSIATGDRIAPVQPVVQTENSIRPLAQTEKEIIETAIRLCGGNIPRAAARLEVSPSTIYRKRAAWKQNAKD